MEKRGQIWVETVLYTLIGLAVLAVVLSLALPQIEVIKDRSIVNQVADALRIIDTKIHEVEQAPGNIRIVDVTLQKGTLTVNGVDDTFTYLIDDTRLALSEPGVSVTEGNLVLLTEQVGSRYSIRVVLNYSGQLNITYRGEDSIGTLTPGSTGYAVHIENRGGSFGGLPWVDINSK